MTEFFASVTPDSLLAATAAFFGFLLVLFLGSRILPGTNLLGVRNADGSQISYRLNGFLLWLILVAVCALGTYKQLFSLGFLHTHFASLLVVVNIFAFTTTVLLYLKARGQKEELRSGPLGVIQDMFFGAELNPSLFGVDLKMFSYRPSLMGLGLLNVSFAVVQYQKYGFISQAMCIYQIFYFLYLCNYFQFEYGMVYTWDIIAEKFGWMLVWGDYVLVPFFYSLPGWYLVDRTEALPTWAIAGVAVLYTTGFILFRGSNEQKHQYKHNPKATIWGKPAETVGGKLLVSGFWGIGRKLNYTGELLMYSAWSLTTGFGSVVPYILPLWLLCLFTHRAWRDEQRCAEKYGPLWKEYCARASFRMFPFLY